MLAKLALVLKSKVAIAVVGAVVVAGGGATVALAATGGHLQLPLVAQAQSQSHAQAQQHRSNDAHDTHGNAPSASHHDGQQAEGVISSIDATYSSFVLKPEHGASVTVVVNSKTVFEAGVGGFSGLKVGLHVEAKGTLQSNGALLASQVEGQGANHGSSSDDHGNSGSSGSANGGH